MVTLGRRAAKISFAKATAGMFAGAAGTLVAIAPHHILTMATTALALPDVMLQRAILVPLIALLVGGVSWLALRPVEMRLGWAKRQQDYDDGGYADVDEDAPLARRRPIFATDELGAPLMSNEALASTEAGIVSEAKPGFSLDPFSVSNEPHDPTIEQAEPIVEGALQPPLVLSDSMPEDAIDDVLELEPAASVEPQSFPEPLVMPPTTTSEAPVETVAIETPYAREPDKQVEPQELDQAPSSIASLIQRLEEGLARRAAQNNEGPRPDPPAAATFTSPAAWLADIKEQDGPIEPMNDKMSSEDVAPAPVPGSDDAMRERLGALRRKLRG
jgi:hypothetical protein